MTEVPFFSSAWHAFKNGFVLNRGSDDVRWRGRVGLCGVDYTENGVIIRLRAAAGKDNFLRSSADECSDLFPRGLHGGTRALAVCVNRRRVTKIAREKGSMASSTSASTGVVAL